MGTTYQVKAYSRGPVSAAALTRKIDLRLEELNQVFSTYRSDSEISRFNRFERVGEPFAVSEDFIRVMAVAEEIHRITGGAWDGTVDPLVRLWGFHDKGDRMKVPAPEEIRKMRQRIGFRWIGLTGGSALVKHRRDVALDLASVAKGFAVDEISALLSAEGLDRHLVEIGGEIAAVGVKKDGSAWKVGINRPEPESPTDSVYRAFALTDRALATSGDYRNYFVAGGKVYSHVIDPRTGRPAVHGVVSATVLADTCVFADGLATALMVLPARESLRLVERLAGVECLLVVRSPEGGLSDSASSGFPRP